MALSNWDTLAFDDHGEPSLGTLEGFDGGHVAIYKNWLYVGDPKMWTGGRSYVKPIIAQVNAGRLNISEFEIIAGRHEGQSAVFMLAFCRRHGTTESRLMAGIGCYGFSDGTDALCAAAGVNQADCDAVWTATHIPSDGEPFYEVACQKKGGELQTFEVAYDSAFEPQWVGVLPATLEAFFAWLDAELKDRADVPHDWLASCRRNGGLRFNQGDAYFAQAGLPGARPTAVGQAEPPLMIKVIDELKGKR